MHALLLVGGFAGSDYLKQRIHVCYNASSWFSCLHLTRSMPFQEQFSSRIPVIARPPDADTATLRGAATYGLARRALVSSVIAPRSYIMKVSFLVFLYRLRDTIDWCRSNFLRNQRTG